jgi:DNA segregation ATPase FtsK/SpoIIIE-like protein
MTTENESGLPSQANSAEQGAQQVEQQIRTDATTGQQQQEQQQVQQPEQQPEQKRTPWFQTRIDELTRARHEERRRAEEAQQRLAQYEQQFAQMQQGLDPEQQHQPNQFDVRTLAQQEASRMLAEQRFADQCNKVYSSGKAEFPDFDQSVANLQMVGVSRDFLELATSSDVGAKLLHHLGTDLDEAARIASLPPVQMARELTRLEFKLGQPAAPKPVSKAPAPITPLGSSATNDVDPTRMSDAEWYAHRQKTRK